MWEQCAISVGPHLLLDVGLGVPTMLTMTHSVLHDQTSKSTIYSWKRGLWAFLERCVPVVCALQRDLSRKSSFLYFPSLFPLGCIGQVWATHFLTPVTDLHFLNFCEML